ncbi:MAG TPA: hypothetical protein VMT87_16180 [Vicinamibacteria bacterium]|nr:hypothetical protein [Vicinamibacteria bacterium]
MAPAPEKPPPTRYPRAALVALVATVATALAVRFAGPGPVRLELGAYDGGMVDGPWSRTQRAEIDPQAATDDVLSFYYRIARPGSRLDVPLASPGPVRLSWRARAVVRSSLGVFVDGRRAGEVLAGTGPWARYDVDVPAELAGRGLRLSLSLRPLARVAGDHVGNPEVLVDFVDLHAPRGFRLGAAACLGLALVPAAVFAFASRIAGPGTAAAASVAGALTTVALARVAVLPVAAAAPRLVPLALLAGLGAHALLRRLPGRDRRRLAWLVAAGTTVHGALPFFPNHNPPDLETHVTRTLDFAAVPLEREALLRYGSHLPTRSQVAAPGSDLFGTSTLIPYSPLPYLFYYGLARAGLDLHWAMSAFNAALLMAVVPAFFLAAARLWSAGAAWLAALLYALDLPLWHHLGRAHAPASFGAALTLAALCFLARHAEEMDRPRRIAAAALLLCAAALGYSSALVLVGLFGVVFLLSLALDARGVPPRARLGASMAMAAGGLLALAVYYGHYVPGVLAGAAGVEAEPDLFRGATFAFFHNESRQALRVWRLGFWIPVLAGLVAAPLALRRAWPAGRPVLTAWLCAWVLVMVLKEPAFLPRLLRWAKEDQFLSPLLALLIAGAAWSLPRAWMRWTASAAAVAAALALQLRDYWYHANSLRL